MLFESAHVRVTAEYGTATLWLNFPGDPVNALDAPRLRQFDAAIAAVKQNPFVRILVVRSAKPAGFCAGLHPEALASLTTAADRAAFAGYGQRVFARLAALPQTTVAFIDGPCLGAGLELALACDHRLCVAQPTTHLGFPDRFTCFGGSARLPRLVGRQWAGKLLTSGRTLSGREARSLGLVDHAFCERRSKIELRTFLDTLERRGGWKVRELAEVSGDAAERRRFSRVDVTRLRRPAWPRIAAVNPVPPFPAVVGLLGDDDTAARIVADVVLRRASAVVCGSADGVAAGIALALARGFVTPLEADQARARVTVTPDLAGFEDAGLVLTAEGEPLNELAATVRPRCVVAVSCDPSPGPSPLRGGENARGASPPSLSGKGAGGLGLDLSHPRRVIGVRFRPPAVELVRHSDTDADTVAAMAAWLAPLGFAPTVVHAARVSARLAA
jgi:enoyl-CoA hydratase/carnithine racemase